MAGLMKMEDISKDSLEVSENISDDSKKCSVAENMNCKYMLNNYNNSRIAVKKMKTNALKHINQISITFSVR